MTAISSEVERLVPPSGDWPLLRGLLVGALVGATVAGVLILTQTIQSRRGPRRAPPGPDLPPIPPLGAEPSPL